MRKRLTILVRRLSFFDHRAAGHPQESNHGAEEPTQGELCQKISGWLCSQFKIDKNFADKFSEYVIDYDNQTLKAEMISIQTDNKALSEALRRYLEYLKGVLIISPAFQKILPEESQLLQLIRSLNQLFIKATNLPIQHRPQLLSDDKMSNEGIERMIDAIDEAIARYLERDIPVQVPEKETGFRPG